MLVVSRRPTESITIQIAQGITIHILGVKGNEVKVGITAPREVVVLRSELLEKSITDK